jgi:hypothetical protein
VTSDFWGIGLFYIGVALLLVALDCAAVGLKFVSHGNAYERAEARIARRREHEAAIAYGRGVEDARTYGESTARVVADGIDAASHDEQLSRAAAERARSVLYAAVAGVERREIDHGDAEPQHAAEDRGIGTHRRGVHGPANRRELHPNAGSTRR